MEQLDAQARFQLLNELRHRGFTHMKRLGSLCELPASTTRAKARIASKRSIPYPPFHRLFGFTNNDGQSRLFIRPIPHL